MLRAIEQDDIPPSGLGSYRDPRTGPSPVQALRRDDEGGINQGFLSWYGV